MKNVVRLIVLLILLAFEIAILYACGSFGQVFHTRKPVPVVSDEVSIFIKNNGFHTDFVLPYNTELKDWSENFHWSETTAQDSAVQYIQIGWGDRSFFLETPTWDKLTAATVTTAVLGLNPSAIHTKLLKQVTPDQRCVEVKISERQYKNLISYIEESIDKDEFGKSKIIHSKAVKIYGINDAFYEAKGHLSLLKTCNTWINNGLSVASMPAVFWTIKYEPIFELYQS